MAYTFSGGIHVDEHKDTSIFPIESIEAPKTVALPLSQHIGAPAVPIIAVGDTVKKGQLIAKSADGLSCPIHASISGKIKAIEERLNKDGRKTAHIIIENDFLDELSEDIVPFNKKITDASTEEIIEIVKNAGISGMGGATFPTYAKIQSAIGKVDTIIVNCAECEPYITANHRLILEDVTSITGGIKILLKALNVKTAYIAIEDNKPDAIKVLKNAVGTSKMISVKIMKTKYPQGDERQLIYALGKAQLPTGKLPADMGYVVFNAETVSSIYYAFATGMPLIERVVTVAGDCIKRPRNLRIPLGTSFNHAIEYCGGFSKEPGCVISGGPMMGVAQWTTDTPVIKGTSAILALSPEKKAAESPACLHCGKCVSVCPMHLMPLYLALHSSKGDFEKCEKTYNAMSCVECGSCTYTCPAQIPIVQHIRLAKGKIREQKNNRK